ncbi:MAG: SprT-like domain-containing protein [Bacteroidetes bacterium]|nr:SprT-like domain-containing protein [Bacteroidota bacterium]
MSQLERNQSILHKYIPEKAVPVIADWIYKFDFKLKIKKSRSSKYGDYRPPYKGENHIITINHDLNKYAFMITLVHEIAHLSTYNKHKNAVKPHGDEWKLHYKFLMQQFLVPDIFPLDVINALRKYMNNPAASSCSDTNLLRVLKNYDTRENTVFLEDVPSGATFSYNDDRFFIKGDQIRKRIRCKALDTKAIYLFNPLTEVLVINEPLFGENKADLTII